MTNTEINFLLWGCGGLLAVLAFVGSIAVNQLMHMARDLNEIKIIMAKLDTKHDELEKRVHRLEKVQYAN